VAEATMSAFNPSVVSRPSPLALGTLVSTLACLGARLAAGNDGSSVHHQAVAGASSINPHIRISDDLTELFSER